MVGRTYVPIWRWLGVFVSAAMFGLAHLYRGSTGVLNTAITGLVLAIVYIRFGRIWLLLISHYLHDALQIGVALYLIWKGLIQAYRHPEFSMIPDAQWV